MAEKGTDISHICKGVYNAIPKGVLVPCLVRPKKDGRYELVSGYRRVHACKRLGLDTIRCEVRDLTRPQATIAMVESNFQRSTILPSEKAFAYKMRLEAMKKHICTVPFQMGQKVEGILNLLTACVPTPTHHAPYHGTDGKGEAVEKGLLESMERVPLAGCKVVNVKAVLYDGSYHDVDSNEVSFKIAAGLAFKKGIVEANPCLMDPIMHLDIVG